MNTIEKMLGESSPQFTEEFSDLLDLARAISTSYDIEDVRFLRKAVAKYEATHGPNDLTKYLKDESGFKEDLNNWAGDRFTVFLAEIIHMIADGTVQPYSLADQVMMGYPLGFSLFPPTPENNPVVHAMVEVMEPMNYDMDEMYGIIGDYISDR